MQSGTRMSPRKRSRQEGSGLSSDHEHASEKTLASLQREISALKKDNDDLKKQLAEATKTNCALTPSVAEMTYNAAIAAAQEIQVTVATSMEQHIKTVHQVEGKIQIAVVR